MKQFENQLKNIIQSNKLFKKKDTLLVSFSGGPDSVCLLNSLYNLNYKTIILIYFDHQLRSKNELKKEKEGIVYYSNKMNLKLRIKKIPIQKVAAKYKLSAETVGHLLRKQLLIHYANFYNATCILTAHHQDDVLETNLLNILRGAFFSLGLKMVNTKNRVPVIRPLLIFKKEQILNYCKSKSLLYSIDSTNKDIKFKRNWVRKKLIPALKENSPHLLKYVDEIQQKGIDLLHQGANLCETNSVFLTRHYYFYECDMSSVVACNQFDLNRWVSQVLYAFYEFKFEKGLLKKVLNRYINLNTIQIQKITESLIENKHGNVVMLPKDIQVFHYNKMLYFYSKDMLNKKNKSYKLSKENKFQNLNLTVSLRALTTAPKTFLNKDKCYISTNCEDLYVRFATQKDTFIPFGRSSEQSLWTYLSKQKLTFIQRTNAIVVCKGHKIVWVPGFCIDNRYKVDENSSNILEIKIQPLTDTVKRMISYK